MQVPGWVDAGAVEVTTPGPHPGVIVVHEAFGPVEHIRDVADPMRAATEHPVDLRIYTVPATRSPPTTARRTARHPPNSCGRRHWSA
jgi:hypothetical protein